VAGIALHNALKKVAKTVCGVVRIIPLLLGVRDADVGMRTYDRKAGKGIITPG
jgi:hypothetical protein